MAEEIVRSAPSYPDVSENVTSASNLSIASDTEHAIEMRNRNALINKRLSKGQLKLNHMIHEIDELAAEDVNDNNVDDISKPIFIRRIQKSRKFLRHILEQPAFHYTVIILIIVDLIAVFIDLVLAQLSAACFTDEEMDLYNATQQREDCLLPPSRAAEAGEQSLYYFSLIILCLFVLEIFVSFYAFGWRRYTKLLFFIDAFIVFASFIMEIYFHFGNMSRSSRSATAIILLRLWKIIRAIHAIAHSISLRNRMIIEKIQEAMEIVKEEKEEADEKLEKERQKVDFLKGLLEVHGIEITDEQLRQDLVRLFNQNC